MKDCLDLRTAVGQLPGFGESRFGNQAEAFPILNAQAFHWENSALMRQPESYAPNHAADSHNATRIRFGLVCSDAGGTDHSPCTEASLER
jgi:hypothetical protein